VFQIDDDILTEFGVVDYMKAIVLNKTGGLDVLKVSEVQKNNRARIFTIFPLSKAS